MSCWFCLQSLLNPPCLLSLLHPHHKGLSSGPHHFLMELLSKPPIYDPAANLSPWLLKLFLECTCGYLLLLHKCHWIPTVSKTTSKLLECYIMPFTTWTWTCQPPFWPNPHESLCQLYRSIINVSQSSHCQGSPCWTRRDVKIVGESILFFSHSCNTPVSVSEISILCRKKQQLLNFHSCSDVSLHSP